MIIRTYIRTLFNGIFKNNFIIKSFKQIVNFYCNFIQNPHSSIKFQPNMSIKDMEKKKVIIFQSVTGDKIDCK